MLSGLHSQSWTNGEGRKKRKSCHDSTHHSETKSRRIGCGEPCLEWQILAEVTQYDVELFQRVEHFLGKKLEDIVSVYVDWVQLCNRPDCVKPA